MIPSRNEADLLCMIRLAPAHLRSDNPDFVVHIYREGLGREPEYDPAGPDGPNLEGDPYDARTRMIRNVTFSDEGLQRGHEATLDAFAAMLGYRRDRWMLVATLLSLYPSHELFAAAADDLIVRIRENSRRQDRIVAMCAAL